MPAPLIPRKILFGNADKLSPQISPDGRMLAYLAPHNGVCNVYVRTIGRADDRPVTSERQRDIQRFVWQMDSRHVLHLQDKGGDENYHVHQTDISSLVARDLTPFDDAGVLPYTFAGTPVLLSAKHPDEMLVAMNVHLTADGQRTDDRRTIHVYRINLQSGLVALDTKNSGDASSLAGFCVDNDLVIRGMKALLPDGSTEIRIRDGRSGNWQTLEKWGADESMFANIMGFSPDNRRILLSSSVGANAARLVEIDHKDGSRRILAKDPQYDVFEIIRHPATHELQAVSIRRRRLHYKFVDKSVRAHFATLKKVQRGDITIVSRDHADRLWVVRFDTDKAPAYYYLYDRVSGQAEPLFSSQGELAKYKQLTRLLPVSFTARDGMKIHAYLSLPYGARRKNLPLVVHAHGGPWSRHFWGFNSFAQWLTNRGYAVLLVDFRGSAGYGKDYCNAGDRQWGAKMLTDLLDGKEWAIKEGFVNPQRTAIIGESYGGYAVLSALAFAPDEFACGVDMCGPSNLVTLLKSTPPSLGALKSVFDRRIGNPDTDVEFLQSRSPLYSAQAIKAPLLIVQGAKDPRVPQGEADAIADAVRKNGQAVEYLLFPDEGHWLVRPENKLKFHAAVEQFLSLHLGGRAEPPAQEEDWQALKR